MPIPGDIIGGGAFIDSTYNGTRIELESPTKIILSPFIGSAITIARQPYDAASFAKLFANSSVMNSDGTNSGVPLADDTLYFVYACSNVSAYPFTLAASDSPPIAVGADWYLGTSGEGIYARFVGCVVLKSAAFVDSETQRLVWNQWNRIEKSVFVCPNFSGGGSIATYVVNEAAFASIAGDPASQVEYITGPTSGVLAGDVCSFDVHGMVNAATTQPLYFGLGIDGPADSIALSALGTGAIAKSCTSFEYNVTADSTWTKHAAYLLAMTNGVNATIVANEDSLGGSSSPAATYLAGLVWC